MDFGLEHLHEVCANRVGAVHQRVDIRFVGPLRYIALGPRGRY